MGFNSVFKGLKSCARLKTDDIFKVQTNLNNMEKYISYLTENTRHINYEIYCTNGSSR